MPVHPVRASPTCSAPEIESVQKTLGIFDSLLRKDCRKERGREGGEGERKREKEGRREETELYRSLSPKGD